MRTGLFKLSTKDLATLAERIINTSQKSINVMVSHHPLLLKLNDSFTAYDKAYAKQNSSGMGKDVSVTDKLRDMPFKGMREVLHGISRVDGLTNQQEAIDLYSVFEQFGIDMDTYSYSSENAQMKKLIEALDLPENQAKLAKVNLTEMYAMLKVNHQSFLQTYDVQTETNAVLHQQKSASSLRNALENDMQSYLNLIDVMSGFDSTWSPLKAELNEIVKAAINSKTNAPKTETTVAPK